jgi:hypothetical protein
MPAENHKKIAAHWASTLAELEFEATLGTGLTGQSLRITRKPLTDRPRDSMEDATQPT